MARSFQFRFAVVASPSVTHNFSSSILSIGIKSSISGVPDTRTLSIVFFLFFTTPVATHALANAARYTWERTATEAFRVLASTVGR